MAKGRFFLKFRSVRMDPGYVVGGVTCSYIGCADEGSVVGRIVGRDGSGLRSRRS